MFSIGKAWKVKKSNLFWVKLSLSRAHKRGCSGYQSHSSLKVFFSRLKAEFSKKINFFHVFFLIRRNTHSNTNSNTKTNINSGPVSTVTIPYNRGALETIARYTTTLLFICIVLFAISCTM